MSKKLNLNDMTIEGENNSLIKLKIKHNNNFIEYISLIKILAAFLVILKHTNRTYWVFSNYWTSTNIMCSFCMCAVPLFNLCIGATLLDFNKRYKIYEYWAKRFKKLIIPIIGWNIIKFIS